MNEILIKIEGSGNGIKTVFPNLDCIANKLLRPPEFIMKYFSYEFGTIASQRQKTFFLPCTRLNSRKNIQVY